MRNSKVKRRSGMAKGDHKQQETPKLWQEFLLILPKPQNSLVVNFSPFAGYAGEQSDSKPDYLLSFRL